MVRARVSAGGCRPVRESLTLYPHISPLSLFFAFPPGDIHTSTARSSTCHENHTDAQASMHNDLPTEPWLADYIVLGPSCSEVRVMQKREWDSRRGGSQESVWAGDKDVNANLVDLSWAVACINARRLVETRGHSA